MQWMLLGVVALLTVLWFWPVRVAIGIHQAGWQAELEVQLHAFPLKRRLELNISEKLALAMEHVLKRWRAKGEPVKVPLQKTIRLVPRRSLVRMAAGPLSYLGRRTRCTRLSIAAQVGSSDAMEAALLTGAVWAVAGSVVGQFSKVVRLGDTRPAVQVVPDYSGPAWRLETDCILGLRLGHAIVAAVWLLRRVLRDKEVVAWARDGWRRKGVKGSGRTSDPGANEDGHGEP